MQSSEAFPGAGAIPHDKLSAAQLLPSSQLYSGSNSDASQLPVKAEADSSMNNVFQPTDTIDPSSLHVDNSSENGEDVVMKDKLLPKVKQVSKCSYCENNSAESLKTVPCLECGSRCHIDCIKCTASFKSKILLGDDFFHFKCFKCTDGNERFRRYHLSWVDVVHITLFNLTHNPAVRPLGIDASNQFGGEHGPQEYGDSRVYFHYKADVARFIDQHWSYFWTKSRGETWINSASSALSTNSTENVPEDGRFESGKAKYNRNGMWALTDDLRFPSSYDSLQQQKTRTIMYSFAEDGSLIELRTQAGSSRRKRRTETTPRAGNGRAKKSRAGSGALAGSGGISGYGGASGKRGSRGRREQRSAWSISMWPDIDNPQGPAHMSREETHAAAQFVIESDRLTVWNDKGYRMAKASHGVETGAWYFEAQILEPMRPEFNLRIGWSQISGELQAPCGYDVFSYSVRAKPCTRFHAAIGSPYGEEFGPGDTLGVLIYLPSLDDDEKQDLADRKWRPGERYRQFTYSRPEAQRPYHADSELPPLPVLSGSELVYFKNGKCLGPAFQKLYLGKYYPAISSYMGGKVKVNLGPEFKFPLPAVWHNDTPIQPISALEYTLPEPSEPKETGDSEVKDADGEANIATSELNNSTSKPNNAAGEIKDATGEIGDTSNESKGPMAEAKDSTVEAKDSTAIKPTVEANGTISEGKDTTVATQDTITGEASNTVADAKSPLEPADPSLTTPITEGSKPADLEPEAPATENPPVSISEAMEIDNEPAGSKTGSDGSTAPSEELKTKLVLETQPESESTPSTNPLQDPAL
ncbi:transcription factor, contains a PHD finger motif [Coemansia brasiliensis]|uniref:Transcription factor, contains a PHD finger motif n=1 Tax=Coemansia brasiliensis TaxID=2650707 RepID=A0A9W8M2F5_9FUNG|nr:transcription factor, contains a PHD finger motif [Coemansia brasiliensis]